MRRALVLAAHPDDAELGAGGLLASATSAGIWTASGALSSVRATEASAAARVLGTRLWVEGFPDGDLGSHVREMIGSIERAVEEFQPDLVAIPPAGDTHQDHRAVRDAALSALRRSCVSVVEYQSPSSPAGWAPDYYVRLSEGELRHSVKALAEHVSQSGASYFEEGLQEARYRAAGIALGGGLAEPYKAVRIIA